MIKKLKRIAQALLAGLLIMCMFAGLLIMLCENDDWDTQKLTLFGGLMLFLIGAIPSLLLALFNRGRTYGDY